ncbi:MAG: hypothetical protein LUC32_00220 [Clostridiales bacterium]|nr:hypothetical protein [Clostridiales bacterium]
MKKSKTETRYFDVRKKLMASLAMVLIAAIMVVSATYAWFTLSTAPEVSGMTTTVGSNGSLEIALLTDATGDTNMSTISSAVGDSSAATGTADYSNTTWGNLVDLSSASYGLEKVTLYPARLNLVGDATNGYYLSDSTSPLLTAEYGTDGRVTTLKANTSVGKYYDDVEKGNQSSTVTAGTGFTVDSNQYGVMGIGTSSDMTAGTVALNSALSSFRSNKNAAQSVAKSAISTYGSGLADIIVNYGINSSSATFDSTDWSNVTGMVTALGTAVDDVEASLKYAVIAYLQGEGDSYTDLTVNDVTFSGGTVSVKGTEVSATGLSDYITAVTGMQTSITNAEVAIATVEADNSTGEYSWTEIKSVLTYIMDTDSVTVADMTVDEILDLRDTDGDGAVGTAIFNNPTIVVTKGLLADIATYAGTYQASVGVSISYGGATVSGISMTLTAQQANAATTSYATISAAMPTSSYDAAGATVTTLTDLYAYRIDLAVRTNASSSKLLLQTEAANRVSGDTATEGTGSTFVIDETKQNVSDDAAQSLLSAIRVAFVDSAGNLLGVATVDNDGYITLKDYEVNNGALVIKDKMSEQSLTSLSQNVETQVSVYVYLDGDAVDNGDVAADGTSLTGTLNLQFASSAELTPMTTTTTASGD